MAVMRVGFDARAAFLDPNRGFGRVARSLADALLELLPGEIVLFVPHGASVPARWYPLAARIVQLYRPHRGAWVFDPVAWTVTLRRYPADVLHLPAWGVPLGLPVPAVATFHDATPCRFPSPPAWWPRTRARMAIRSVRRAAAVHAVSEHAKNELISNVRIDPARVRSVLLGVGPPFGPAAPGERGGNHLLFVGGSDPHKNLDLLLRMLALPGVGRLPNMVVAGSCDPVLAARVAQAGLTDRIDLVPRPSDQTLARLYRQALATLVPSRNEGFGLPALEAMACGCPVLAARAGALPEVCGNAGVLLDPDDAESWRDTLLDLQGSPGRQGQLAEAGVARARELTWEACARGVAAIYERVSREAGARH